MDVLSHCADQRHPRSEGCPLTCAEFDASITQYLDTSLPLDRLPAFYLHACVCEDCRTHLACYRKIVALLREERRTSPA